MKRWMAIVAVAAMTGACATVPGGGAGDLPTSISYETTPCFGFCPVYQVTVNADGTGTFVGERNTSVSGSRPFTVTRAEYAEFARRLSSVRPATGEIRYDHGTCEMMATDMQTIRVNWNGSGGTQSLSYDLGCDREKNRSIIDALREAPEALPLAEWIKRPEGAPLTR